SAARRNARNDASTRARPAVAYRSAKFSPKASFSIEVSCGMRRRHCGTGLQQDCANAIFYPGDDGATGSSAHMHRTLGPVSRRKHCFPCVAGDRYHAYFTAEDAAKACASCRIAELE